MATTVIGGHRGRLRTIRDALTPKEWGRVGAMAGIVIFLNVLGWAMLRPPPVTTTTSARRTSSGSGPVCSPTRSGCATPSTPTTSRPSTTRPAS